MLLCAECVLNVGVRLVPGAIYLTLQVTRYNPLLSRSIWALIHLNWSTSAVSLGFRGKSCASHENLITITIPTIHPTFTIF